MRKYLLLISALIVVLDRITKWLVVAKIPLYREIEVVPGLFQLTHLENPGAAFSMFANVQGPWASRALLLFSFGAASVMAFFLWKLGNRLNLITASLALFLGGTVGNLWDRLRFGRVTDFLDFYVGTHHWPPFNVADSTIVVAAIMLAVHVLFMPTPKSRRPRSSS